MGIRGELQLTTAERIVVARRRRGLTQAQAGKALGLSQTGYARYESGARSLTVSELAAMAELYDVAATWLAPELAPEE